MIRKIYIYNFIPLNLLMAINCNLRVVKFHETALVRSFEEPGFRVTINQQPQFEQILDSNSNELSPFFVGPLIINRDNFLRSWGIPKSRVEYQDESTFSIAANFHRILVLRRLNRTSYLQNGWREFVASFGSLCPRLAFADLFSQTRISRGSMTSAMKVVSASVSTFKYQKGDISREWTEKRNQRKERKRLGKRQRAETRSSMVEGVDVLVLKQLLNHHESKIVVLFPLNALEHRARRRKPRLEGREARKQRTYDLSCIHSNRTTRKRESRLALNICCIRISK